MKDYRYTNNPYIILELMGVALAAVGFGLIAMGFMLPGFLMGVGSCASLIPYFALTKQKGLFALQVYFMLFNTVGVFNNVY